MTTLFNTAVSSRLLAGNYDLPVVPDSIPRLLALLMDSDVNFRALEAVVGDDPMLAAHVLRVANTPGFSPRGEVNTLRMALTRVGTRNLLRIALSLKVSETFAVSGLENLAASSWRLARRSAVYAAAIARYIGEDPEVAFLCGLLHAIGQPVILSVASEVAGEWGISAPRLLTMELMEQWYVPVGENIACSWSLPQSVQAAIAWQRRPLGAPEYKDETLITCVASFLASCERLSPSVLPSVLREHPAAQALYIGEGALIEILGRRDLNAQADALGSRDRVISPS